MNTNVKDHKEALLGIILRMQAQKSKESRIVSPKKDNPKGEPKKRSKECIKTTKYSDRLNCDTKVEEEDIENCDQKHDIELEKNANANANAEKSPPIVRPTETPLTISTITATGSVGCNINMASLYYNLTIDDVCDRSIKHDGFTYIEWGQKGKETLCKGLHKKMTIKHKRVKEGKRFDKQITVILRRYEPSTFTFQYQNLKIFYNGMIQMTGLKSVEQGMWVLQYMIDTLRDIKMHKDPQIYGDDLSLSLYEPYILTPHDYSIRLINSNFCLGYAVNRRVLCNYLNTNGIYNVFEASRYPGVKIPFYWREGKASQDGFCACDGQRCTKRSKGFPKDMDGVECHKITIIVFQSGSIIITGGQSMEQIKDAYTFITSTFAKIKDTVKKPYTHTKYSKTYPKFTYNNINEKKMSALKLPHGYTYDRNDRSDRNDRNDRSTCIEENKQQNIQISIQEDQ